MLTCVRSPGDWDDCVVDDGLVACGVPPFVISHENKRSNMPVPVTVNRDCRVDRFLLIHTSPGSIGTPLTRAGSRLSAISFAIKVHDLEKETSRRVRGHKRTRVPH